MAVAPRPALAIVRLRPMAVHHALAPARKVVIRSLVISLSRLVGMNVLVVDAQEQVMEVKIMALR